MSSESELFDKIYYETKADIYRYICIHCRSIGDIDDIFQDTYIALFEYLQRHRGVAVKSPAALLITITKRVLIKYHFGLKRRRAECFAEESAGDDDEQMLVKINKLILKKPPLVQKIFLMRHSMGMSFAQIADALGKREGTIKAQYYKAIADIRRHLEKEGDK
ncbi:MAG: RNA polymerase sigma factor [Ruminococcus sp.]|nr:RNA polymerase sigma factor [Ruminococcus sp.]